MPWINLFLSIIFWSALSVVIPSGASQSALASAPATTGHPLGKPAQSLLIWENDEEFLRVCEENQAQVRMAAFQTTLPDPLPGEEYNVGLAAQLLAGTVVPPGGVFSMNGTIGRRTRERGFREGPAYSGSQIIRVTGGGVCKISTTLYNVAILADMAVVERKPHGMLVPYVPPGQDATVSYGTVDFKFRNTYKFPVVIWAEKVGNTLYMAFYGRIRPPRIIWDHQILNRQPIPTLYLPNPRLPRGTKKVIQAGAEGITVKNRLIIHYPSGETVLRELGTDYYRPMARIVETGPG
ncbi:MAG TPA: VanW family protein [Bacillota bacterium]